MARQRVSEAEILRQLSVARARSQRVLRSKARAMNARFDRTDRRLHVSLMNGGQFSVPVSYVPQLRRATDDQIAAVQVDAIGLGLHWEALDADVSVVALAQALLGRKSLLSAAGTQGGSVRSAAKAAAARENGLRGGRPAKKK